MGDIIWVNVDDIPITGYVYALISPSGATKYIGSTFTPFTRLEHHLRLRVKGTRRWIDKLDTWPSMKIIDTVICFDNARTALLKREVECIIEARNNGCVLLNKTPCIRRMVIWPDGRIEYQTGRSRGWLQNAT